MDFRNCEKQIFKIFVCNQICRLTKNQKKVMQPTTSNNDSRPAFPYHAHNEADCDKPFINGKGFIYLGISKMIFTF